MTEYYAAYRLFAANAESARTNGAEEEVIKSFAKKAEGVVETLNKTLEMRDSELELLKKTLDTRDKELASERELLSQSKKAHSSTDLKLALSDGLLKMSESQNLVLNSKLAGLSTDPESLRIINKILLSRIQALTTLHETSQASAESFSDKYDKSQAVLMKHIERFSKNRDTIFDLRVEATAKGNLIKGLEAKVSTLDQASSATQSKLTSLTQRTEKNKQELSDTKQDLNKITTECKNKDKRIAELGTLVNKMTDKLKYFKGRAEEAETKLEQRAKKHLESIDQKVHTNLVLMMAAADLKMTRADSKMALLQRATSTSAGRAAIDLVLDDSDESPAAGSHYEPL
jgi:chromosome segregation ATPase